MGFLYHRNYCFYAENNKLLATDFDSARARCQSMGQSLGTDGDLASMNDTDEFTFIKSIS
jgi:hypothetical protein